MSLFEDTMHSTETSVMHRELGEVQNEKKRGRSFVRKPGLWILGIAVVIAIAAIVVIIPLTHEEPEEPIEELYKYIQNNGESFEGGYRLTSNEKIESGQTSLIAYGDGSYVFAWDLDNSIIENTFRLKLEPKNQVSSQMVFFEVTESIQLQIGLRYGSESVTANGVIEKKVNTTDAKVVIGSYQPFRIQINTVGDIQYYSEDMVEEDVRSIMRNILEDVSTLLELSGTGVTLEDFGFIA